ncbi:MAG: hypothetical protein Greene071436_68 [Parcubacteria group bacterium Greene0714_36]|nr:MAG: hypothetical protein Greene071436_68 [Parcubacteria group bacterium Greene0714_36]
MALGATNPIVKLSLACRNPVVLFFCTLALALSVFLLHAVPTDAVLSGQMSLLEFFRLPLLTFYLTSFLLWVELLRHTGLLALTMFLLALGTISLSAPNITASQPGHRIYFGAIALGELIILAYTLLAASLGLSGMSVAAMIFFALLFLAIRVIREKEATAV